MYMMYQWSCFNKIEIVVVVWDIVCVCVYVIAETELGKLQRQFRIMEGEQQAYNIHSQELIRKQQSVRQSAFFL